MSYITVLHIPSLRNGRQLHAKVAHQVDRWAALRPTRTFLTGLPDVECPCANHPSPPHPPGSALTWGGLGTPSIRRCFTSDPVTEISDEGARNRPARLTCSSMPQTCTLLLPLRSDTSNQPEANI
uniref:Uncharacterized protein n=1 Tax=Mesocestoides corti TaxID=53468 RepID=A0A5K3FSM9_MESCO